MILNHENPISVARYYSDKAKAQREFDSRRLSEHEVLLIVQSATDGEASAQDLLKVLYPGRKAFNFAHHHIAEMAFSRIGDKGLLKTFRVQRLPTKKRGPPILESRWCLTDTGQHNLMTRATGSKARDILEQIEAGE
ncbi:hypothetical protein SAMN04489711_109168 [Paracidovorax wautersii]|uniref:Uncharacterized protein n=1 Tax=Paracidovorax wautersii TaxID=1177982 RepID=A0A1I2F820_9BURK|nr:hypothetical protein SAMN04489711_109168 [Paracidovorax wautersii]